MALKTALKKVGKTLSGSGASVGSSMANMSGRSLAALGAGAFAVGMGSEIGPAARDASFDAVLGTPDADRYFTGRKLSARFLLGEAMGGAGGTALQATAPGDFAAVNPIIPTNPVTGGAAGFVGGGGTVAAIGGLVGSRTGFGAGRGAAIGGAIGGMVGGAVGATAPVTGAITYSRQNREFFRQSPYGRSSSANAELSAVGDIVLGMHNSRRGY